MSNDVWLKETLEVDPNKTYYYVKMDKNCVNRYSYNSSYNIGTSQITALQEYLVSQNLFDENQIVWGFQYDKKLVKLPNAIDFVEFAVDQLRLLIKTNNVEQHYANYLEFKTLTESCSMLDDIMDHLRKNPEKTVTTPTFTDLKNQYDELYISHVAFSKSMNHEALKGILDSVNFSRTKAPTKTSEEIRLTFKTKYPMAQYLENRYQNDYYDDLITYMNERI